MSAETNKIRDKRNVSRRVARIREVLDELEEQQDSGDHLENAKSLLGQLKTKQRRAIMESALTSHLEAEDLKPFQAELIKMQAHLESTGRKAIILFDGRDAAGKGGTIRRVTRYMNEKHYRVVALGKPSDIQRTELHMKRYIEQFPHAGEIVLFDRSWYNRAMVEPVMGFCSKAQYRQFMKRVLDYEKSFLSDGQTTLIKLYFSVSKKEQSRRFERRRHDPLRQWKLSEVDLQAQELWDEFTDAKYQLLKKTHHKDSPWYIIR
jgi:polyphosphate kinase 2